MRYIIGEYTLNKEYPLGMKKMFTILTLLLLILSLLISTYTSCNYLSYTMNNGCKKELLKKNNIVYSVSNDKFIVDESFYYSGKRIIDMGEYYYTLETNKINSKLNDSTICSAFGVKDNTYKNLITLVEYRPTAYDDFTVSYKYGVLNNNKYYFSCFTKNDHQDMEYWVENIIIKKHLNIALDVTFMCSNCYKKGSSLDFEEIQKLFTQSTTLFLTFFSFLKLIFNKYYESKYKKTSNFNEDMLLN